MKKLLIFLVIIMLAAPFVFADLLLDESFEGGVIPDGWTVLDEGDDGDVWFVYNSADHAYTGEYSVVVACYSSADAANDWLITPQLSLRADDWLGFWARSWYSVEDFEVKLSTTGTAPQDFNVTLGTETADETYMQYVYDLSAYAGQDCYLAIVWYYDNYALVVDDVMVGTYDPVENESTSWGGIKALYR